LQKDDTSPESFEKALSALTTKITAAQTQLDQTRAKGRRVMVLSTLYLGFAYLVYAIVLILVVGWRNMGAVDWTAVLGGPILIVVVRTVITDFVDYRTKRLSSRLKDLQAERAKTIQKLKDATKYESTLELLQKYGGPENKEKRGTLGAEEDESRIQQQGGRPKDTQAPLANRINILPPPTANIQRPLVPRPVTPQPRPHANPAMPEIDVSAEFAPNAFDGRPPPAYMQYPPATMTAAPAEPKSHWYDRILDTLLGEDETAAKNRIVLICSRCRLVNGQAPPGTKSLTELGLWKCMACGAPNGEIDEGKRIVQEVLGNRAAEFTAEAPKDTTSRSSSDLVEVDKEVPVKEVEERQSSAEESGKSKG